MEYIKHDLKVLPGIWAYGRVLYILLVEREDHE